MNQHEKERGGERSPAETSRTTPSVAPVALHVEEERAGTKRQRDGSLARKAAFAIGGTLIVVAAFGVARSLVPQTPSVSAARSQLAPPGEDREYPSLSAVDEQQFADLADTTGLMSLPPDELQRAADRANSAARMSLQGPDPRSVPLALVGGISQDATATERASTLKSATETLLDVAAEEAQMRCMNTTELQPTLLVRVTFGPDGRVVLVNFGGTANYRPAVLDCVEDVFDQLVIPGYHGGETTFTRRLVGSE